MRTKYFKKYPGDDDSQRGRNTMGDYYGYSFPLRINRAMGVDTDQAAFLERVWSAWFDEEYTVGPDYVASWEDCPMGFSMFKIKSLNPFLDRCAIERADDLSSYVVFDLRMKRSMGSIEFIVYDIKEYHLSDEDEMLIRLSL